MPPLKNRAMRYLTRAYPFLSGQGDLVQMPPLSWLHFPEQKLVVPLKNGLKVVIYPNDIIGKRVYFFGDVDRKITALLNAILERGETLIDVGANIGIVSIQCLPRIGAGGRVVAVEPQSLCAEALRETVALNGISNLEIHTLAISDRNGQGRMELQEAGNLGTASLKPGESGRPSGANGESDVPIRDAGEFLESLAITEGYAVKIDVEGHEAEIIASACSYWTVHPPKAVLFESWTTSSGGPLNERFFQIERNLSRIGLEVFKIRKSLSSLSIEHLVGDRPDPASSDYVALRPDVEDELRASHPRWFRGNKPWRQ